MPSETSVWEPSTEQIRTSNLSSLITALATPDYDTFLAKAKERPDLLWRATFEHLGIDWLQDYHAYIDTSRGKALPRWFEGGHLNATHVALKHARGERRNGVAIIEEDEQGRVREASYAEIAELVGQFSLALTRLGFKKGDRIGIALPMGVDAAVALLAIFGIGAIAVPLFSGFGPDAIRSRLEASQTTGVICSAKVRRSGQDIPLLDNIIQGAEGLESVKVIVVAGDELQRREPHIKTWNDAIAGFPLVAPDPLWMDPNDPLLIVFTSGTSGQPKGARHIHGGFPLKAIQDAALLFDLHEGDVWLWPSDLGWIVGPISIIAAFSLGVTLIAYDGAPDWPNWRRLPELLSKHRVTHFGLSPSMTRALAKTYGDELPAAPNLKLVVSAGEVLGEEEYLWLFQKLGRSATPVINYTGGTEASGAMIASVVQRRITPSAFNSSAPGIDVVVVDENGDDVWGQRGELAVRAPFVGMTAGFWNDEARYLETYWSKFDGVWVHGDYAAQEADGRFFVFGRSDDVMKIGGKRIGPTDVESIALKEPEVAEIAAIGVSIDGSPEQLILFAVCKGQFDPPALESRIASGIENVLGSLFRPSEVILVDKLPKTRNGKVLRRVVKAIFTGSQLGDLSALSDRSAIGAVQAACKQRHPVKA